MLRCAKYKFISEPETSQGRQCQRYPTRSARAIIFSTASDQISPTRAMEEVGATFSTSRSLVVKTRISRKSPAVLFVEILSFNFLARTSSLFGNIVFFVVVHPSCLSLFLRPRLHLPPAIPPDSNLGQSRRINSRRSLPTNRLPPLHVPGVPFRKDYGVEINCRTRWPVMESRN